MSQHTDFGPESTSQAVEAVSAATRALDYERASDLAEEALANGIIHPALLNARAIGLELQGRNEEALAFYQQARAFAPRSALLLNAIGLCLTRLFRYDEAIETFDEAIRIAPAHAPTYQSRGLALGYSGRWKEAEASHARAAQLDPRLSGALASVASLAARRGDGRLARREADRALRLDPSNATAHTALAQLENAQGQFQAAEARLKLLLENPALAGHGRAVVLGLLGDALDGSNKTHEAYEAYAAANKEHQRLNARRFTGMAPAPETLGRMVEYFRGAAAWSRTDAASPRPADAPSVHAFLLGFPRTGTTLLEQALQSHGDVVTLEERDVLADFAERYLTNAADLDRLANLAGPSLAAMRETYWQRVHGHVPNLAGKTFVDKHPLHTLKLPLIAKLFPDSKILFALRDPRDVVFSCFRRHLNITLVNFELLTLEGAAGLYDRIMELGLLFREKLPLAILDVRYEGLVLNFDGVTRSVCEFLGIPWSERLHAFAETARSLDPGHASAPQLRRGLFAEGVGQWRRYERELAPVMPILEPWIKQFRYA